MRLADSFPECVQPCPMRAAYCLFPANARKGPREDVPSNCLAELPCFGGPAKPDPDFATPPCLPESSRPSPGCWDTAVAVLHAPSHPLPPKPNRSLQSQPFGWPDSLSRPEPPGHENCTDFNNTAFGPHPIPASQPLAFAGIHHPNPDVASWHHFPATSPSLPSSPLGQVQVHRTLSDQQTDASARSCI